MKKTLLYLVATILVSSCVSLKEKNITYVNGECYPTNTYVDQMIKMRNQTGLEYVWFECEWVSQKEVDSIKDYRAELVYLKMLETYSDSLK